MNQQKSLQRISEFLAFFVKQVESENAMGFFDKNRIAEDIFIPIFSEIFDCKNLVNLNLLGENYAGLDLADEETRVAFQITSNVNNKKVKDTLQSIIHNKYYEKYDTFIIYDITEKQSSYSESGWSKIIDNKFNFTSKDIFDYKNLSSRIRHLDFNKIRKIEEILESQYPSVNAHQSSQLLHRYTESLLKILGRASLFPFKISISSTTTDISLIKVTTLSQDTISSVNQDYLKIQHLGLQYLRLTEAIEQTQSFFIVGPSGYGKTTALQRLAFIFAQNFTSESLNSPENILDINLSKTCPIYIRLSECKDSLINHIVQSMREKNCDLSEGILLKLLKQGGLILLLDGFDEILDKRRFCDDIKDIHAIAPETKIVISSRYVPAISSLSKLFTRYDVAPLSDEDILEILSKELGAQKAEELFLNLVEKSLIDEFRSPLIIGFISKLYEEESSFPDMNKCDLYQTIVNKWFTDWEARRKQSQVDYEIHLKIITLAHLGYEMFLQNASTIEKEKSLNILAQELNQQDKSHIVPCAQEMLDYFLGMRILYLHGNQLSFSHLSFRDFFAAIWMESHFSLSNLLKFSLDYNKHESIIFLFGLLESKKARRILLWYLRFIILSLAACQLRPVTWATNYIFLLLRGLLATKESHDDLKDQFIQRISKRKPSFLSEVFVPAGINFLSHYYPDYYRQYAQFYALIGQLKTTTSVDYLQNEVNTRQFRLAGFSQFQNPSTLLTELTKYEEDYTVDKIIVGIVFRYPPQVALAAIKSFINQAEPVFKKRLLESIASFCRNERNIYRKLYEKNTDWFNFLVDIYLNDEDTQVSDEALSIIRNFGEYQAWLTPDVEHSFIQALDVPSVVTKCRALWGLVYSKNISIEVICKIIDNDKDLSVVLIGLEVCWLHFRDTFPMQVIKALKRFVFIDIDIQHVFRKLGVLIQENMTNTKDNEQFEQLTILICGALLAARSSFRIFSIRAILLLKFVNQTYLENFLNHISLNDSDSIVRGEAIWVMFFSFKETCEDWLYQGLKDSSPEVRCKTITLFPYLERENVENAIPFLQNLASSDPTPSVRKEAKRMIKTLEYIIKKD